MLNKAMEFARGVRDSVWGKIFFRKGIANLDFSGIALPSASENNTQGKETESKETNQER